MLHFGNNGSEWENPEDELNCMYPQLNPLENNKEKEEEETEVLGRRQWSYSGWKVVSMHVPLLDIRSILRSRLRLLIYKSQRLPHLHLLSLLDIPFEATLPLGTLTRETLVKTRPDALGCFKH